jgi:hypothetical protein
MANGLRKKDAHFYMGYDRVVPSAKFARRATRAVIASATWQASKIRGVADAASNPLYKITHE